MSNDKPELPKPRFKIEFGGHAQTWDGLERIIRQMLDDIARKEPGPVQIVSGSGYHVVVTEPDPEQTQERWEQELEEWRVASLEWRKANPDD